MVANDKSGDSELIISIVHGGYAQGTRATHISERSIHIHVPDLR